MSALLKPLDNCDGTAREWLIAQAYATGVLQWNWAGKPYASGGGGGGGDMVGFLEPEWGSIIAGLIPEALLCNLSRDLEGALSGRTYDAYVRASQMGVSVKRMNWLRVAIDLESLGYEVEWIDGGEYIRITGRTDEWLKARGL